MKANSHSPGAALHARVAASYRLARTLVLTFAASIVVYTVIALVLLDKLKPAATPLQQRIPFYVAVLFLAFGSMALRRTQFRKLRIEVVAGLRGAEGLIKHFFMTTMISAAMAEAIGVLAIVMAFIGGDTRDVLGFGAVGLCAALASYPRQSAWVRTIEYYAANAPDAAAKR